MEAADYFILDTHLSKYIQRAVYPAITSTGIQVYLFSQAALLLSIYSSLFHILNTLTPKEQ